MSFGERVRIGAHCDVNPQNCELDFTITKVTNCTGRYAGDPPPAGTQRKLVWVEVTTGSQYSEMDFPSSVVTSFDAVSAAGVTSADLNPSTYWECAPKTQRMGFGDDWLPGKKYAGAVEIYLPKDAVKIVNGEGLLEWALG